MLRPFLADLHVHTVLSPCAEVEMIPPLIVKRARDLALGVIAVTDHNSAETAAAVVEAAKPFGIAVLPGLEVQSREEVHLLCLFDTIEQALRLQQVVYDHLPALINKAEVFGAQFVVDATGEFVRVNDRLLLSSLSLSVEQIAAEVSKSGGLCVAAHVDRPSFSLLANLGLVPEGLSLAAVEITHNTTIEALRRQHASLGQVPIIRSGDAHRLGEMSDCTVFTIERPTIAEISMALQNCGGRRVKVVEDLPAART